MDNEGERVKFPALCYPQYSYFYNHLQRFLPRFRQTVENGNLAKYVVNGESKVNTIMDEAKHLFQTVTVYVFGLPESKQSVQSLVVHKVDDSEVETRRITIEQFKAESKSLPHLACVIATFFRPSDEEIQKLVRQLDPATDYQRENILIFNKSDKTLRLLTDVISDKPSRYSDVPAGPKIIERMLEDKIVEWYDQVTAFVQKTSPKDPSGGSTEELGTYLSQHLKECVGKSEVIKELLSPKTLKGNDVTKAAQTEIPIEKEILCQNLRSYCMDHCTKIILEEQAKRYGLTTLVMHELLEEYGLKHTIEKQTKSIDLEKWVSEYTMQQITIAAPMFVDAFVKALKENTLRELNSWLNGKMRLFDVVHKLEFELHGMLRMTTRSKTKIPIVPRLTYALQSDLISIEDVKSCFHNYGTLEIHVDKYDEDKEDKNKIKTTTYCIEKALKKHQYKHRYVIRRSLRKHYHVKPFISHGNELHAKKLEQEDDVLDSDKQWFLASIGCFVKITSKGDANKTEPPKPKKQKKISVSSAAETPTSNSVDVKHQAGEEPSSEPSDTTCSTVKKDELNKARTCQTESKTETMKPSENSLFAITCAHAVQGCKGVFSPTRNTNDHLGHVINEFTLYEPHCLDLACIEILDAKKEMCERSALREDGIVQERRWRVLERKHTVGMQVYMFGAVSKLKHGHIASSDVITEDIERFNKALKKNADDKGETFDPLYTLLIEPNACLSQNSLQDRPSQDEPRGASGDGPEEAHPGEGSENKETFSKEGDSGSVIWCVDEGKVCAVALLCGAVTETAKGEIKCSSYGSSIKQLFKAFENRFNCTIKPARSGSQSSSTESEGEESLVW